MKKYKQILFLYHVKERELLINKMMAECVRRADIADEIVIEEFCHACYNIFDYNPDIIVTFLPRDEVSANFLTLIKFLTNAFIISIPTEGIMEFTEESMQILIGHNSYSANLVDLYMFWGTGMFEYAGNLLLKQGKALDRSRLKVFGYLPYEEQIISKFHEDTELSKKIECLKKEYKKCVMFVTGFQGADYCIDDLKEENVYEVFDDEVQKKAQTKIDVDMYYRNKYLEILEQSAKKYKDYLFLLKTHPVELQNIQQGKNTAYNHLEKYENVILIKEDMPISLYMKKVDLFIHYGSTTAMEAYIHKIPTIQLLNNHKDACVNNSGTCILDSTVLIDVENTVECVKEIGNDVLYVRLAEMEEQLRMYVNYEYEEEYKPSEILTETFENLPEVNALRLGDKYIRKSLRSKNSLMLYLSYYKKFFVFVLRRDFKSANRILKKIMCCELRG